MTTSPATLSLQALPGLPEVRQGDDIAEMIVAACDSAALQVVTDTVFVVAQKIVSKSEGRAVALDSVTPTAAAERLAQETGKDPRVVELILRESNEVLRQTDGVIVVEHRSGFVMANAGIDQSNVAQGKVLLLPEDIDASAAALQQRLQQHFGVAVGVIISDSVGRAWRLGTVGHALGVAGMTSLLDLRGRKDREGRELQVSETALADNVAAAASILMGEAGEGLPVVIVNGVRGACDQQQTGKTLLRDKSRDLFR